MKKMRIIAVLAAAAMALSACGVNSTLKKTAMEIGDVKVTAGDIATMTNSELAYSGSEFETVKDSVAEQMEKILKYGEVAKAMGVELTDEEKSSATALRAQYASSGGGYNTYSKFLKDNGSSIEFYDTLFTASAYTTKLQEQITKEFEDKEVTDEELNKFYNDSYYCAKHILIKNPEEGEKAEEGEKQGEELAKELLERAKNGENFDDMIKEYSEDPGSESNPDGYVFTEGQMVKPFEKAVKELKVGEFGFCESSYGYHVILRVELPAFDSQKDTVSSKYSSKRIENRFDELVKEHNIKININQEVIDAIDKDMLKEPKAKTEEEAE